LAERWRSLLWTGLVAMVGLSLASPGLVAQPQTSGQFEPKSGRPGKDVEWVPTPQVLVEKMLDLAKVTARDYVIDLGSGDGRTVLAAAARGARAHGIEFDAAMVALSQRNAAREGFSGRATFARADLFKSDLSKATVITMFLLPQINLDLRPKLLNLKPGTRIVSNTWDMEQWEADETVEAGPDNATWRRAYLWIVPAKVDGTWRLQRAELVLKQQFQVVSGTFTSGTDRTPVTEGRLRGDQIEFNVGSLHYNGRVSGNVIEGTTAGSASAPWRATR
jgi:SAM-dependent methyltransferase